MVGRRSARMDKAMILVAKGSSVYKAAEKTGVSPSALYRAIKNKKKE